MTKIKYTKESKRKAVPKHLRQLPENLVTHDAGDEERIHRMDPIHVVKELAGNAAKKLAYQIPPIKRAQAAIVIRFRQLQQDPFRFKTLDQEVVDLWRAKTILSWLDKPYIRTDAAHLWFPEPHGNCACLRDGPSPPRDWRPKHLKNLNLDLDVLDWSMRMRDIVKSVGVNVVDAMEEINGRLASQKAHEAAASRS